MNHGKIPIMSLKKAIGLAITGIILLLGGVFLWQVLGYYRLIRAGEANPIKRESIRKSIERTLSDPRAIQRLEKQGNMDDARAPYIGANNPKLTIVEFLDYGCPFCQASFEPIRELVTQRKDEIRLVVRDFPVDSLHPGATQAAIAARCADKQGKFWSSHDKLFVLRKDEFSEADILQTAREVGLDKDEFTACLKDRLVKDLIDIDLKAATEAGVEGTPTFFFNGIKIEGAIDRETLQIIADEMILRATK